MAGNGSAASASRRGLVAVAAVVIVVAAVIGVFFATRSSGSPAPTGSSSQIGAAVPADVLHAVTSVSASTLASVGVNSSVVGKPQATTGGTPLVSGGKPEVFYLGADFCPYCAAERWALVVALSRFGTFSNLHLMMSSSTDVYPNTNTFTFYKSSYSSKYLEFVPVEFQTRTHAPLQSPTAAEQKLVSAYDAPPYVPSATDSGSIPFVDLGNRYVIDGASYSPQLLSGLNWQTIAGTLNDPSAATAQAIDGTANEITAAVCTLTKNQPGSVCATPLISSLQKSL